MGLDVDQLFSHGHHQYNLLAFTKSMEAPTAVHDTVYTQSTSHGCAILNASRPGHIHRIHFSDADRSDLHIQQSPRQSEKLHNRVFISGSQLPSILVCVPRATPSGICF
jgi:hypothetical protein